MGVDAYRKSAKNYDKFVEPLNAALRQIAMKLYPPMEGLKVLEVGCGTGTNLELYHNAGCHVHGIDIQMLNNPEQYCVLMYGPNWRNPEKEWDKAKHLKVTKFFIRYNPRDKELRNLWLKRGEKK